VAQALADGDDIYPASDQLRRVSVSQGMERDCGLSHAIGKPAPLGRHAGGAERAPIDIGKQKTIWRQPSLP
jgi:hypothetical protein